MPNPVFAYIFVRVLLDAWLKNIKEYMKISKEESRVACDATTAEEILKMLLSPLCWQPLITMSLQTPGPNQHTDYVVQRVNMYRLKWKYNYVDIWSFLFVRKDFKRTFVVLLPSLFAIFPLLDFRFQRGNKGKKVKMKPMVSSVCLFVLVSYEVLWMFRELVVVSSGIPVPAYSTDAHEGGGSSYSFFHS